MRGIVLTVFCALLTAVGHVAGGGSLPDLDTLAVVAPLLAAAAVWLADRAGGLGGTVAVLGGGQLALHLAMQVTHPMQAMGSMQAGIPGASMAGMLGMHAAVTVVVAVAVRHAETAAARVAAAMAGVLARRIVPLPADRPLPARCVPAVDLPARLARLLAAADLRRGPPVRAR